MNLASPGRSWLQNYVRARQRYSTTTLPIGNGLEFIVVK